MGYGRYVMIRVRSQFTIIKLMQILWVAFGFMRGIAIVLVGVKIQLQGLT